MDASASKRPRRDAETESRTPRGAEARRAADVDDLMGPPEIKEYEVEGLDAKIGISTLQEKTMDKFLANGFKFVKKEGSKDLVVYKGDTATEHKVSPEADGGFDGVKIMAAVDEAMKPEVEVDDGRPKYKFAVEGGPNLDFSKGNELMTNEFVNRGFKLKKVGDDLVAVRPDGKTGGKVSKDAGQTEVIALMQKELEKLGPISDNPFEKKARELLAIDPQTPVTKLLATAYMMAAKYQPMLEGLIEGGLLEGEYSPYKNSRMSTGAKEEFLKGRKEPAQSEKEVKDRGFPPTFTDARKSLSYVTQRLFGKHLADDPIDYKFQLKSSGETVKDKDGNETTAKYYSEMSTFADLMGKGKRDGNVPFGTIIFFEKDGKRMTAFVRKDGKAEYFDGKESKEVELRADVPKNDPNFPINAESFKGAFTPNPDTAALKAGYEGRPKEKDKKEEEVVASDAAMLKLQVKAAIEEKPKLEKEVNEGGDAKKTEKLEALYKTILTGQLGVKMFEGIGAGKVDTEMDNAKLIKAKALIEKHRKAANDRLASLKAQPTKTKAEAVEIKALEEVVKIFKEQRDKVEIEVPEVETDGSWFDEATGMYRKARDAKKEER